MNEREDTRTRGATLLAAGFGVAAIYAFAQGEHWIGALALTLSLANGASAATGRLAREARTHVRAVQACRGVNLVAGTALGVFVLERIFNN